MANPWQFAGGFKDNFSGYYKFGTRYYDPTIGRWTQPDPSGMEANTYAYAAGNPVNFVDPTGLYSGNYWVPFLPFSCPDNRLCRFLMDYSRGRDMLVEGGKQLVCSSEEFRTVTRTLGVTDVVTATANVAAEGGRRAMRKAFSTQASRNAASYGKLVKGVRALNTVSAVATAAEVGCMATGVTPRSG